MEFVHPALLGGAALAVVPVILHFILKQKPKRFEFPALRFVKLRRQVNQRRMRLQHLLLLALRIAAICLLAFALARPSMRASGVIADQEAPVAAALVFETAPHMGYRHDNQARLEVAQEIASKLLSDFPHESQVAVLDTRGQPAVFQVDLGAAHQRVERLELTPVTQPILTAIDEALRLLADATQERREIYIFTDLSAASWSTEAREELNKRLVPLPQLGIYIVDVGVAKPQDFSLGEVRLNSQILAQNSPLVVSTDLVARGTSGERGVVLEMLDVHGKPQKRNQETWKLADGQPQAIEFSMGGLPIGTHQGQLRLVGADGLVGDDVRYFTVEVQEPWRILIAAPQPATITGAYLSEALAPDKFRKQGLARFQCEVLDLQNLQKTELAGYAGVFILDPPALPAPVWQKLADYAQTGGGVALFLGENAAPPDAFSTAIAPLMQLKIIEPRSGPTQLNTISGDHPLLRKFKPLGDQIPWDAYPIYHYWQVGPLPEGMRAIVSFADKQPALLEQPLGRGRGLIMTTSVSDPPDKKPEPWNQLLSGLRPWPFFMFANELALYLVGSSDSQINYPAGQSASLRLHADEHVTNYLLSTPQGEQIRGTLAGRQDAVSISGTDTPGHYRVRAGGSEGGFDRGFSTNLSSLATGLDRIDPVELKKIFGKHEFRLAHGKDDIERAVSAGRVGRELYPWLIVFVAIAVGLEQVVSNRFYRNRE